MEGNPVADYESVASTASSNAAPEGAAYASVWCDVASVVEGDVISPKGAKAGEAIYSAKEIAVPANIPVQIPNIIPGVTTITVTDI